jgi:hypothetical protein
MIFPRPSSLIEEITKNSLNVFQDDMKRHNIRVKNIQWIRTPLMEFIFAGQKDAFNSLGCGEVVTCYHGTKTENMNSISDIGFLDPENPNYKVVNGNVYGKGIYMSKDITYSRGYAKNSLIVTACLPGVNDEHSKNPVNFMLVLNSKSQVLPLFVAEVTNANILVKPVSLENIPLFDFAKVLSVHMKNAETISNATGVSLGTCLHLCHKTFTTEGLSEEEGLKKITEYLDIFQVE